MNRKLIVGERIMYVDEFTPLNCVFTVKIRGGFSEELLRNALHKIQQKHYLLRTTIKEDKKGIPYFVLNDNIAEIPVRLVERNNDDDWKIQSKAELAELFIDENKPLIRIVWIKGKNVSDLLLTCAHCISDGTSFASLMGELLLLLDHPEKELTGYPFFNSVKELVSASFTANGKQIFKARLFSGLAKLFFLFKPTRVKKPLGDNYMLHWKLNTEETSGLMVKCKVNGVTVHAALCVAFLEAFKQIKGDKAHGKVICPVDIRRFIKEIKDDNMFAFAPITELTIDKYGETDFWLKAKKLKTDLDSKIAAMEVYELLVMSEYFQGSVKGMIKLLKSTEGNHDITLSNMGRLNIQEQYDSFEVETIYSPNVSMPWRNANTAVISTFKGQMDFIICSNNSFLNEAEAEAIKDKVLQLLLEEDIVFYA